MGNCIHIANLLSLHVPNHLLWWRPLWTLASFLNQRWPQNAPFNHQDEPLQNTESAFHDNHLPRFPYGIFRLNHQPFRLPLIIKLFPPHPLCLILPQKNLNMVYNLVDSTCNCVVIIPKGVGLAWDNNLPRSRVAVNPLLNGFIQNTNPLWVKIFRRFSVPPLLHMQLLE